MEVLLLSVHVLAGILFVGGSAVAASLFPRYVPVLEGAPTDAAVRTLSGSDAAVRAIAASDAAPGQNSRIGSPRRAGRAGERDVRVAGVLHRITRVYGILGVIVPLVGITLALVQGRMGEIWITVAMVLTAAAGGLLAFQIYPRQREALAEPGARESLRTIAILVGVYNLLWVSVVVLMILRPGSAE